MDQAWRKYADEIAAQPDVSAVILFGSRARGTHRPDSDVDLLVLVPDGFRRALDDDDGQAFELLYLGEDVARSYFQQNIDTAAEFWATARPCMNVTALHHASRRTRGGCSTPESRRSMREH